MAKSSIKISNGNSKVGRIPNLSLTPGRTCSAEACKTCLTGGCYAMKSYRMYSNVRSAWDHNTEMAIHQLGTMEEELTRYFAGMNDPRFFRLHVAGDFVSREYAQMWARIATNAPHTNFLAFTKQWDNVRGVDFPSNFSLVLSAWPGTEIPADLRERYSVAWLEDGTGSAPADAMECHGNCETCGACWGLARMGIDVKFAKH